MPPSSGKALVNKHVHTAVLNLGFILIDLFLNRYALPVFGVQTKKRPCILWHCQWFLSEYVKQYWKRFLSGADPIKSWEHNELFPKFFQQKMPMSSENVTPLYANFGSYLVSSRLTFHYVCLYFNDGPYNLIFCNEMHSVKFVIYLAILYRQPCKPEHHSAWLVCGMTTNSSTLGVSFQNGTLDK